MQTIQQSRCTSLQTVSIIPRYILPGIALLERAYVQIALLCLPNRLHSSLVVISLCYFPVGPKRMWWHKASTLLLPHPESHLEIVTRSRDEPSRTLVPGPGAIWDLRSTCNLMSPNEELLGQPVIMLLKSRRTRSMFIS